MKKTLLIASFLISALTVLTSCQKNLTETFQQRILGRWYIVGASSLNPMDDWTTQKIDGKTEGTYIEFESSGIVTQTEKGAVSTVGVYSIDKRVVYITWTTINDESMSKYEGLKMAFQIDYLEDDAFVLTTPGVQSLSYIR